MIEKLKIYNKITQFSFIARRYFVNNFYDGMLTILGILLGFFVLLIKDLETNYIDSSYVILTSLGTSISMLISGISGSYLSERAEQKTRKKELQKAMVIFEDEKDKDLKVEIKYTEDIQKAMVTPINMSNNIPKSIKHKKLKKKAKTLHEKAESFASKIVASVNGVAPFTGGIIPIIPFFFIRNAGIMLFITSFIIIMICIVFLGVFLGVFSKESIIKNILEMSFAFALTVIISIVILGI